MASKSIIKLARRIRRQDDGEEENEEHSRLGWYLPLGLLLLLIGGTAAARQMLRRRQQEAYRREMAPVGAGTPSPTDPSNPRLRDGLDKLKRLSDQFSEMDS